MSEENIAGDILSYSSEWIHRVESETHWRLYWKQQKLIEKFGRLSANSKVLEIGPGSGFTANYLTHKGFDVTTLDIDEDKRPDIIANIVEMNLEEQYDLILAFEVFEHAPFKYLAKIAKNLSRSCKSDLVISLPHHRPVWFSAKFKLANHYLTFEIKRPRFLPRRKLGTNHHWELGHSKETSVGKIGDIFQLNGFNCIYRERFLDRGFFYFQTKSREL